MAVCVAVAKHGAVFVPVPDALSVLAADIPWTYENVAVAVRAAVCVLVCVEAAVGCAVADDGSVDTAVSEPVADAVAVPTPDMPGTYETVAAAELPAVCVANCDEDAYAVRVNPPLPVVAVAHIVAPAEATMVCVPPSDKENIGEAELLAANDGDALADG